MLLSIVVVTFVAACGFEEGEEETDGQTEDITEDVDEEEADEEVGSSENSIHIAENSEIPTLDSSHAHDSIGFSTLNNINEGLYRGDDKHEPQLALAEEHEVDDAEIVQDRKSVV